jgi:hypothetical protein
MLFARALCVLVHVQESMPACAHTVWLQSILDACFCGPQLRVWHLRGGTRRFGQNAECVVLGCPVAKNGRRNLFVRTVLVGC